MEVQINDTHRIVSDKRQFILQERNILEEGERKGEWTQFKAIGYFGSLHHLIKKFKELQIYNSNVKSLEKLACHIEKVDLQIEDIVKGIERKLSDA